MHGITGEAPAILAPSCKLAWWWLTRWMDVKAKRGQASHEGRFPLHSNLADVHQLDVALRRDVHIHGVCGEAGKAPQERGKHWCGQGWWFVHDQ